MFYLIGDIFENSNQFVIFDILCALAGFGYKKNDLYNYKINLDLIIKSINNIVSNSETLFPISMIFYILSDF